MMAISGYDDLQLRIDRDADGTYRVLAMAPDGRTARGSFTPPLSDTELDDFVQRVGLARRRSGSADTRMEAIRSLGSTLFDALIKDDVGTVFYSARSAAAERDRGLRITLRLSGSPELMRLPWEFLYKRPRFIAQSTNTPVVRALDIDSALRPHKVRLPLRILAMVSSPAGYPELDADAERRNLERALAGPRQAGLVEVTWLDRATLGELGRRIAEPDEIHVLHYIGHGAYNEATESGVLVLETPQGRAHDVSGEEVGAMLQDETSLRLVVLNACEGARSSHVDPFSGVAASLVNFDIPAVIGMQFEITDDAAIAFSESLYTGLARGLPIDAALAPARRAIIGAMLATEFGTPVLFLRDGDPHLFDIAAAPRDVPLGPPAVPTTDEIAFESGAPEPEVSDPVAVVVEEPETEVVDAIPRGREDVVEPDDVPIDEVALGDEAATPAAPGPDRYAVPVALAWIAAALITAAVGVVFIMNAGGGFGFGFIAIIAQLLAMTALSVHYLTRPNRDGVASGGYAVTAGLAVFALSSINSDSVRITWAYLVFGAVLILVGARLVYVGRKGDSPFVASLRTPGPFVIAAGAVEMFTQLTVLTSAWDWLETANWFWSIGTLGMAVSYAVSARLLAREVKAQGDGHDSRGIQVGAGRAETQQVLVDGVQVDRGETSDDGTIDEDRSDDDLPVAEEDAGEPAEPTAAGPLDAGDTADWRGTATYERLPERHTRAMLRLRLAEEHQLVLVFGVGLRTLEVDGGLPFPVGRTAKFRLRDGEVERACLLESSNASAGVWAQRSSEARIVSLAVDGVPIPVAEGEAPPEV
jgi:CHAT domain-containing protein